MDASFQIIILIVLLLLSAFFASSELAFVVANKLKIEVRARKGKYAASQAMYFVKNQNIFFPTILIANNVVNIAFASTITIILFRAFQFSDFIILIISTLLILFFGELIPKYLAREYADRFVLFSAVPIKLLSLVLYPVVKITGSISELLIKMQSQKEENFISLVDKDDMQSLIRESSEVGTVSEEESDVITHIFELGDQKVYEIMTPRTEIEGVEIGTSIKDVIKNFVESGYSKLPVYAENLDNIKGVVFAYDMFKKPQNLHDVTRSIIFVPETKRSLDMLNEFLTNSISIAIVVDEFGGTAGLVTVEDIIEEMLGEIQDEYDVDEFVCKKIDTHTFVVSGKVEIDYLNEEFELNLPEGDYETIAGFITAKIGKIPKRGEKISIDNFNFEILHSDRTKIDLLKLIILDK